MFKVIDDIAFKELKQFIGIEIINKFHGTKYIVTGICVDGYMGDKCATRKCFELDDGDVINIENIGKNYETFLKSEKLDNLIEIGLVEKVQDDTN